MRMIIVFLLALSAMAFSLEYTVAQKQCLKACCDDAHGEYYANITACYNYTGPDVSDCFFKCTEKPKSGGCALPALILPLIVVAALKRS
jgi:hypothetical protein